MQKIILEKYLCFSVITYITIFIISCQNIKTEGEIKLDSPPHIPQFVVQEGDLLQISVWQKPEFSQQVPVSPDGKIRLLMIGEMSVKNKTLDQIRDEVSEKLRVYLQDPVVEVSLAASNFGVYLFGEISAGIIKINNNITMLEAIILRGGLGPYADKENIVLIRRSKGKEVRYRFNLKKYLAGEDINENKYLQPGDIIYVPSLAF